MKAQTNIQMLAPKYHQAITQWQKRHFPDLDLLQKYWKTYFPQDEEFHLCAKLERPINGKIIQGKYRGLDKFEEARQMKGSMLYQALRIIKAQCSTELGSIQQHCETLSKAPSDQTRFSVMRIMAEELRHAYQMFWVLSNDKSWSATGNKKIADNLLDELLVMDTGNHVLDAFNISFTDALDNIIFACFIDRVGKFQLNMQEEFAYAPMAASMRPMLKEEAFHLKTGWEVLREISLEAATGKSKYNFSDIQKKINLWYPRALEMFGNSEGGESNLQFSFKTTSNNAAISAYTREIASLMDRLNLQIFMVMHPGVDRQSAMARTIENPSLYLPSPKFLRLRSNENDHNEKMAFDVQGNLISHKNYKDYLCQVLPEAFFLTTFGKQYLTRHAQQDVSTKTNHPQGR